LVQALSQIADLPWTCTVAGSLERAPETARAILAQVAAAGLSDRIAFLGEVSDTMPLYRAADIFVLPSRYEGYGMVFAEAMAHGLPVVAAATGAIPEVVPPSAGILTEAESPDQVALALRRLIAEPEARAQLAAGARRAAAALPRWRDTAALVASALDEIQG
jgi:glycosyltransferase involved in cell wall biosynthesis